MTIVEKLKSAILPLNLIDQKIPRRGTILDLGCGEGVISRYLAQSKGRKVVGVDNNSKRLSIQQSANLKFIVADIRTWLFKKADSILISDVLHHLTKSDQNKVLAKIYSALKKHGVLVIKEIDANEFFRSRLSRFWDLLLYPSDEIHYYNSDDLKKNLESIGFQKVKIYRPLRLFPGSITVFVCKKND